MQTKLAVIAIYAAGLAIAAEWPTDGGNPKRDAWQRDEKILTKSNVKNLKVLWSLKLDNQPQEMHSLFPALIAEKVTTAGGPRQIAIVAGSSDNVYAIDVDTGKLIWKKHLSTLLRLLADGQATRCALRD
jgi:glucose dehydrogenase